ncbi:Ig-like domain-containing protein [Winogradskyella litoriviva]|uniref:Ig-like domain-containing protein n=1 Tax=Winogradskyella litoriviva TaxID=1220182 RepID=A0ABX2E6V6_9FLAO|nr:Ig-like domain-containing protein [Winogradskyella litoriviva]NRD23524.1 Ig-like domain-containing protein [Winogradskyella litoriviva]
MIDFNFQIKKVLPLFFLFFIFTVNCFSQQLAFPEAQGFGKYATGGRGGVVYKVTNTNNDGPGSLRAAVEASGPRTVIFEVSGTINLTSNLRVLNSNLTIAGQTAPGEGICLKGASFIVMAQDVIVRYMRFRLGDNGYKDANGNVVGSDGPDADTVAIFTSPNSTRNIIFDHCSISWSIDENVGISGHSDLTKTVSNVTFQYCIFSEGLFASHHGDGSHSMGFLINNFTKNVTLYKNLFANNRERHIRAGGGCSFEMINNVIYNYTYSSVIGPANKFSVINNYYREGTEGVSVSYIVDFSSQSGFNMSETEAYASGNINNSNKPEFDNLFIPYQLDTPSIDSGITPDSVDDAIADVLENVGAILPQRDEVDSRIIEQYNSNTGAIIDTQEQVGGYPVLSSLPALEDSDEDGMPNDWETANSLNYSDPADRNIINVNGYTNLEHYLNGIELDLNGVIPVTGVETSPESIFLNISESETIIPLIFPEDATNQYGYWISDDPSIATVANNGTVTGISEGETEVRFYTSDGNYMDSTYVNVTDVYIPLVSVSILPETQTLALDDELQLTLSVTPIDASNVFGTWTSSNESVALVDDNGNLTLINEGETEISFVSVDGVQSSTAYITVTDDFYGTYHLYNATTDVLLNVIEEDTSIDINTSGTQINFRSIPQDGDANISVESVEVTWTGQSEGYWLESSPLYAGMSNHNGLNFEPYAIEEGEYLFTVKYYSENSGEGEVVAIDTFKLVFFYDVGVTADAGVNQDICEGESVTLTASGGSNYLWNTGETTETITVTPLTSETYNVTVSDDDGNFDSDSVNVSVYPVPIAFAGEDQNICEGESVVLIATGGTTYLWSTGETSDTIEVNPVVDTIYTVEVSSNNCSSIDEVTIFVNEIPDLILTEDLNIIEGESAILTVEGNDNYIWSTGDITESITVSPLSTTTYSVSSTGLNGCVATKSVTVTVLPEVIANAGEDITICSGETVSLLATGGSNYLWDSGEITDEITVSPLETTTYVVTVQDDYGNSNSDEVTVFVNESPNITVNDNMYMMVGNSVTLTVSGANSYLWSTDEITESIIVSPVVTTTYTVTGSLENGCQDIEEVTITVVDVLSANAGDDVSICEGESIIMNASGGITYTWNTGDTGPSPIFTPDETTTYYVTVTDGFGNSDTDSITVTVNALPIADAGESQTICLGESIILTANGGETYLWSTGETTSSINVNPQIDTVYSVEVFSTSCSDIDEVEIFVSETPELLLTENVSIFEGESVTLQVSGSDNYLWSTGEFTDSIIVSPLQTTTYSVIGTLENGCNSTENVTVTVYPEVIADAGNDVTICSGESITLHASGGVTYLWSTGHSVSSPTFIPNETTTYTVTVTDGFGNSDTDSVTVTVIDLPNITVTDNSVIVLGESITLEAFGAETYFWNNGNTSNSITVNPTTTTTYTVTGYNSTNCSVTEEITITVVPQVEANAGLDSNICYGDSITLVASGGSIYNWDNGATTAEITLSPLETSTYTVTVSDNYGNSDTDSVTITVNELPIINVSENVTIIEGESIDLYVNGALSYLWSTGETSNIITVNPTQTTTYLVTGYSSLGCQNSAEVTVTVIPEVNANAGNDVSICVGESVTLNANGGSNYIWSTGQTGESITVSPISTETYTVMVTDVYGNSDSDSVTVTVNELPIINVSQDVTIIEGESIDLYVNGALSYLWNTGETSSTITVSPTETTIYTVFGTSNSCDSIVEEIVVTVTPLFVASAGIDEHICDNLNYEVVLTANQGDNYLWSTGETSQSIIVSPLSTTTYHVTITNGGQVDTDSVTVYVNPSPEVVIENGESVDIMSGDFITLSASGANTFEWNNGATQPNIAVSPSETTTYEVRGYVGDCYDEKQVTVNVLHPVIADAGEDFTICLDEVVMLTATGGDDYVWNTGETTPTIQVSPLETTEYTVTVFNALDFDEASVIVEVDLDCTTQSNNPLDNEIYNDLDLNIYPNPANNMVNVKLIGSRDISEIHFYDVTGKLIKQKIITNEDLAPIVTSQIDISSFQAGVYFVKVLDDKNAITKKLLVE